MYQLEDPTYFIYLAVIPVIAVLFLLVFWWKKRRQKQFTDSSLLQKLSPERSTFKSFLKIIVVCVAFLALIIGLVTRKWVRN